MAFSTAAFVSSIVSPLPLHRPSPAAHRLSRRRPPLRPSCAAVSAPLPSPSHPPDKSPDARPVPVQQQPPLQTPPHISPTVALVQLLRLTASHRTSLILSILFSLVSSLSLLLTPFLFGRTLDVVTSLAVRAYDPVLLRRLRLSVIGLFLAYVGTALLLLTEVVSLRISAERFIRSLRTRVYTSLIRSDLAALHGTTVPDLLSRLSSDTLVLQRVIADDFSKLLQGTFETLATCTVLFVMSPPLASIVVFAVPVTVFAAIFYGAHTAANARTLSNSLAAANSTAGEFLSGIRIVKAFARERFAENAYSSKLDTVFSLAVRAAWADGVLRGWNRIIFGLNSCIVFFFAANLVSSGILTAGTIFTFLIYSTNMTGALSKLATGMGEVVRASGAIQRILHILQTPSVIENRLPTSSTTSLADFKGAIRFENVSFRYPFATRLVLQDINVSVPPGGSVAFIGRSGGGKSTMAALLCRFYDPFTGAISIDNIDLRDLDLVNMREHVIGIVQQEPFLVSGTLADNIAFGADGATREQIEAAAAAAGVMQFAHRLPNGLDSTIIELSGGEKQRVMIARCLVKDPKIIILDEPTSALDMRSEALVSDTIDQLMRDSSRTVILISHRLTTVRSCDKIYVFGEGEIVEEGSHDQLLAQESSEYQKLLSAGTYSTNSDG